MKICVDEALKLDRADTRPYAIPHHVNGKRIGV